MAFDRFAMVDCFRNLNFACVRSMVERHLALIEKINAMRKSRAVRIDGLVVCAVETTTIVRVPGRPMKN